MTEVGKRPYMKALIAGLIVVILGVVVYSFINSRKFKFYYFPETNMYYDTKKRQYIYSVDGGKTWSFMSRTTDEIPELLGEKVVMRSREPNVWLQNEEHRRKYHGVLTDINVLEQTDQYSAKGTIRSHKDGSEQEYKDMSSPSSPQLSTQDSTAPDGLIPEGEELTQDSEVTSGEDNGPGSLIKSESKPIKRKDSTDKEQDSVNLQEPMLSR